ncbi:helicase-related protein [Zhihengliuella sp. ISTPL4]|uniref:helicase-related protein n=1 Tax=Zhihengliuella sp. ISTPL4 TaxID=2058657 RepID=UPI000C7AA8D7|nr:helicase-related protein [Zhihengliuella sp. ISTPL4]
MTDIETAEVVAESTPITDAREGRDAVVAEVRRRWLGPYGGEEEVLHRSPVYAYLVGTLYPVEQGAAAPVELEDVEDTTGPASRDEELEWETELAAGETEDADAEDLGVNLTGAFGWAPASMGVSFLHGGSTLRVDLAAGVYERNDEEDWVRRPLESSEFIEVGASSSIPVFGKRATLSWRSRRFDGRWLTTVALSNAAEVGAGEAKRDAELCLFQVELACSDETGLLPYPQAGVLVSDDDKELAFRYRDKPSFAIGHGVAVDWSPEAAPVTVRTTTIPETEVSAIRAKRGSGDAVRMRWLADESVSTSDLVQGLSSVARDYAKWIEGQAVDASSVAAEDRNIADGIVERQRRALARIEEGIGLLGDDEQVLQAFRMANAAMRWQMLRQRGVVAKETRYGRRLFEDKGADEPTWRPFQLGFILSSLASTVDEAHEDRELVDLIWFPTGGGKTEAYLGLAAIEMIRRRLARGVKGGGMAVLTRYTMRLLTAQQFQRAATLICALELMRLDDERFDGMPDFSIGLWLGIASTPNTFKKAETQLREVRQQSRPDNPFQLLVCPWCATSIMPERHSNKDRSYGVRADAYGFEFFCPDDYCPFSATLPVQVVDEGIYANPPTMLVATVDKLARLAWISDGSRMFGIDTVCDPPSLVIQDELHLLSGPLGTIVGVYEAAIGALLRWNGTAPKVVASTATTRASREQVTGLMAKPVEAFPPAGLRAEDNHFSEPDPDAAGRLYLGIMPQAHTPSWAIGQIATELLDAPVSTGLDGEAKDRYWTLAVYHNSLRELGRTVTILRDDVQSNLFRRSGGDRPTRTLGPDGVEELNGNVPSDELVRLLRRLERGPKHPEVIDALATTNIMSVGIDVQRLGVMLVNGHTKTTAEYIQATSRVGRGSTPGLVVTMFRAGKPRDRSVFESFQTYHGSYYRFVEPSSVTPWSLQARRRALHAALVILVRHGAGRNGNADAAYFDPESAGVKKAISLLKQHVANADPREAAEVGKEIDDAVLQWVEARERAEAAGKSLVYQSKNQDERLLRQFTEPGAGWPVMNSMRNVDRVVKVRAKGERNG